MQVLNHSWNGKDIDQLGSQPKSPNSVGLSPDAEAIQGWLITQMAERLGLNPDDIDIDEDFANYGLNSIEAVNLSGDLENQFGRRLPPTLLWDYPTIKAIADYLAQDTTPKATTNSSGQSVSPQQAQQLLERLNQMSNAEVESLLNSMLSEQENH
ncbi:MAG: acyl carrier protein [Limnospira sp. PMC 1291.21]|uniref:acyl carrier protein n=1 Tax=unclassified Limnospira TaxID=2642885 RepID=UPI0028E0CE9A|nr:MULTISPECIES: acyl carrier protein [unclassified Limnospira]MDT9177354.1 acyl carrier protein [Limnospira sp. PMC 1238.20]MDT9192646.1 acyl carrier protein [Limnospira sp. PMC 1245.20]MDT9202995.1 acyl carrier protein [Limnospira sp. PMC 1243.20]MDT9208120.1 acyl carrier protein [Limnospira sp. PMC 1252.20]MDT9213232.1 acyl carrier protein [Limnospira sp. PMC 1256.20]